MARRLYVLMSAMTSLPTRAAIAAISTISAFRSNILPGGYCESSLHTPIFLKRSTLMVYGQGSTTQTLTADDVQQLLAQACGQLPIDGKRVLVIIPDGTRTAPIPLMFRQLYQEMGRRVERLDYLIALGTHQPMSEEAIDH